MKRFKLFIDRGLEAIIMLIRSHESLVQDLKLCVVYKTVSALTKIKKLAITALGLSSDKVLIEQLNSAISELKNACKVSQEDSFN